MKKFETIIAESLSVSRDYKVSSMNAKTLGVSEYRIWNTAVKALRIPAYTVRQYRHANLGNAETVAPCDLSPLYTALHDVIELVGVVNGAKLDSHNLAEEIIAQASRIRIIDITSEMAHARSIKRETKKVLNEDDTIENQAAYADACVEVERLEGIAGNCKKLFEIQSETTFTKAVEIILGDAINKQTMKTPEEVEAEMEAKRQARRAKTAAKRAAKKASK
jgi:hypothetical protein